MQCSKSQQHQSQGHDQGLLFKDQDKDKDLSNKDKDCIIKDQDKDCILVLKESLRTRTNITDLRGLLLMAGEVRGEEWEGDSFGPQFGPPTFFADLHP